MYRRKAFYRLDLDNHTVGHHEVDTISTTSFKPLYTTGNDTSIANGI